MALLELIRGPEDVRRLTRDQLQPLADEVRRRLIDVVSQTGGHIGAGLGVVELTVALGYCFDSPRDKIVWDVGHQGYPWKILTGRNDRLPTLRQAGGLSGFLRRTESPHDQFGAGHAGTGLSAAYGIAAARDLVGEQFKVVAVVGDGALTCGLPYEAMNNAGHSGRDIIMVLNDNGMSIAPNVGAINKYLGSIIASPITVRIRERVKALIESVSHIVGGQKLVDFAKTMEESIKNFWSPGMLFEELGFRYFGPIDGHNIPQLVQTFEIVKTLRGPRVVHIITEKGKGFPLPEPDTEKYHARAPYDPVTGELRPVKAGPPQWTTVFGEAITQLAGEYPKLVAITAARPSGTGTGIFQKKWPDRFFDVGIAEAHATTFAGGLATQGIRPVVAIYSTFLQRAYDSIIHDIAIQQLPVIFCLDRAGMVGEDGQTHMGLYDIAYLLAVPHMTVTAPKDGAELIGLLRCALEHTAGPFSKGCCTTAGCSSPWKTAPSPAGSAPSSPRWCRRSPRKPASSRSVSPTALTSMRPARSSLQRSVSPASGSRRGCARWPRSNRSPTHERRGRRQPQLPRSQEDPRASRAGRAPARGHPVHRGGNRASLARACAPPPAAPPRAAARLPDHPGGRRHPVARGPDAQRRPYAHPGGEPRSGRLPDHRYLADPRLGARRPRAPGLRHRVAPRLGAVHRGQAGPESRRTDRVERRRGAQGRRGACDPAPRVRGRRRSRAVLGGRDRGGHAHRLHGVRAVGGRTDRRAERGRHCRGGHLPAHPRRPAARRALERRHRRRADSSLDRGGAGLLRRSGRHDHEHRRAAGREARRASSAPGEARARGLLRAHAQEAAVGRSLRPGA